MDLKGLYKSILDQINNPQPKLISPLPMSDTLNTPGLQYYSAMQQAVSNQAKNTPPAVAQPTQQPQQNPIQQAFSQLAGPKQAQAQQIGYPDGATSYEKQAAPIFQKYGVPPAIGLGIYAEEGRGKTINPNNPYDLGAYDANPQNANAYQFTSPLQGTEEAAKFLAGQSQFMDMNKKKIFQQALKDYQKTGDQIQYLKDIAPTYASDKNYVKKILQTPEFQRWSYDGK